MHLPLHLAALPGHTLSMFNPLDHIMARAGGGGSGSGSGGGGGGVLVMMGYLPAHGVTRWCAKRFSRRVALVAGIVTAVLVTVPMLWLDIFIGIVVGVGAGLGVHSGFNNWLGRLMKRFKLATQAMNFAASKDPAWQETAVRQRVSEVFYAYQRDWSNFDLQNMQTYLETRYYQHAQLMMAALHQMGRRNTVGEPKLLLMSPVDVIDAADGRCLVVPDNCKHFLS